MLKDYPFITAFKKILKKTQQSYSEWKFLILLKWRKILGKLKKKSWKIIGNNMEI